MRYSLLQFLVLTMFFISCNGPQAETTSKTANIQNKELDETKLKSYLKALMKLKNETTGMLKVINELRDVSGNAEFEQFDKIIKEYGFASIKEFEEQHLKISFLFYIAHTTRANKAGKGNTTEINKYKNEIALLEKLVQDNSLPENAKKELKEALNEIKKINSNTNKTSVKSESNDPEDELIEKFNEKGNLKISKSELKLISSYEQELAETYQDLNLTAITEQYLN